MAEPLGLKQSVQNTEPQLRAALQDVLQRFGGKAAIEIELAKPVDLVDLVDDQSWEGNIYKYVF